MPGERQIFVRDDGIYQWTGGAQVEDLFCADDRYWDDINVARLPYAFANYYPARKRSGSTYPTGPARRR